VNAPAPVCIHHGMHKPCLLCPPEEQVHTVLGGSHLRQEILSALGDWAVALASVRRCAAQSRSDSLEPIGREYLRLVREEKATLEVLRRAILKAWGMG
jgi:hypothetical protein